MQYSSASVCSTVVRQYAVRWYAVHQLTTAIPPTHATYLHTTLRPNPTLTAYFCMMSRGWIGSNPGVASLPAYRRMTYTQPLSAPEWQRAAILLTHVQAATSRSPPSGCGFRGPRTANESRHSGGVAAVKKYEVEQQVATGGAPSCRQGAPRGIPLDRIPAHSCRKQPSSVACLKP